MTPKLLSESVSENIINKNLKNTIKEPYNVIIWNVHALDNNMRHCTQERLL